MERHATAHGGNERRGLYRLPSKEVRRGCPPSRLGIAAERLRSPSVSAPHAHRAKALRGLHWSGSVDLPNCTQSTQSTNESPAAHHTHTLGFPQNPQMIQIRHSRRKSRGPWLLYRSQPHTPYRTLHSPRRCTPRLLAPTMSLPSAHAKDEPGRGRSFTRRASFSKP